MNISQEDLRAFLILAEEKSFTRASARCHKSQSAFSSRIRVLEETVGTRLFDRTTRSVELTVEGKLFEGWARQLHQEFSNMMSNFRDYAACRKGRVSIAALPSVAAGWLPKVFSRFHALHPGIELALVDTLSEDCLMLLRSGQVDLAITSATSADDLESTLLGTDRFYLICPKDHPLEKQESIGIGDIISHPFVHLDRNSSVRRQVDAALHLEKAQTTLELRNLATVASMVEVGMGITIVPALTMGHFRNPRLVAKPLSVAGLERPIHLVRLRERALSIAAEAMYRQILNQRSD